MQIIKIWCRSLLPFCLLIAILATVNHLALLTWRVMEILWLLLYPLTALLIAYDYGRRRLRQGGGPLAAYAFCLLNLLLMATLQVPCLYLFGSWPSLILIAIGGLLGEGWGRALPPRHFQHTEMDNDSRILMTDAENAIYEDQSSGNFG